MKDRVRTLLEAARQGDASALDELFPIVYDELRQRAQLHRARWQGDETLDTTAIVHEAYLKLTSQDSLDFESRAHFLGLAAQAMRHILIDYAQRRRAQKRGGNAPHVSLQAALEAGEAGLRIDADRAEILVALDAALERLARVNERHARIVECRFFGGLTIEETAAALDLSTATVKRGWMAARAWLFRELNA